MPTRRTVLLQTKARPERSRSARQVQSPSRGSAGYPRVDSHGETGCGSGSMRKIRNLHPEALADAPGAVATHHEANERRHEYATLEHLLLALTEDQDAVAVLHACSVDLDRLRREVLSYVDHELAYLVATHSNDAEPTASFQRVLQRAAIHVQSSGREEVTGANVLVAMFAERESHAVY